MTYSVLHLQSLTNDKYCGVWCSELKEWVFKGNYSRCFEWKNKKEIAEQNIDNLIYLSEMKKERDRMFTNIETCMKKYFIYSLSDNGNVFYIGFTKDLKTRYLGHINCCDSQTRGMVLSLRKNKKLPDINILYSIDKESDAKMIETKTIQDYALKGHRLCNITGNPVSNRIIIEYDEAIKCALPFPRTLRDANEHIAYIIKDYFYLK